MNILDIFGNNAFSMTSLTATINDAPYKPGRIGDMGLFIDAGVNSTTVSMESKNGT